jgi:hypothetical protein
MQSMAVSERKLSSLREPGAQARRCCAIGVGVGPRDLAFFFIFPKYSVATQ